MKNKNSKQRFYYDREFLGSPDARTIRILAEYFGPMQRLRRNHIQDTIVFFGSARIQSQEEAETALKTAPSNLTPRKRKILEQNLVMSRYYEAARSLAYQLTRWSKNLKNGKKRFIITSGGGPGIMEAANRGATEAKGLAVGLGITLPNEQSGNPWISEDLEIRFHYFFMRKYWFLYLAKALVIFPGGFGTLDELMELLTLIQTRKIRKKIPIVLFDNEFWSKVVNWEFLVDSGTISRKDLKLFKICNAVDEAYQYLTQQITKNQLKGPNF
jgi:hypothetical protein